MADGVLTGGDVMIVFFCVMIGSFSIGNVSPAVTAITAARGAAVTLFDIIDAVSTIYASGSQTPARQACQSGPRDSAVYFSF